MSRIRHDTCCIPMIHACTIAFRNVSRMFQGCLGGCFEDVLRMFCGCVGDVLRMCWACSAKVMQIVCGCVVDVLRMCWKCVCGCFADV